MALILTASDIFAEEIIHHDLHVRLQPAENTIHVIDSIQFPAGIGSAEFTLRDSLTVTANGIEMESPLQSGSGNLRHYRINRLPADGKVQLSYQGRIISAGTQGTFDMPEAVLDSENMYLDHGSAWLPDFDGHPLFTFSLHVEAPQQWQIISQGKRSGKLTDGVTTYTFDMPHPQNDIYLLGGPYQRYSEIHDGIEIVVYLHAADDELAKNYLQASSDYMSMYSDMIGHYPYTKFAIVENRWQTGYGMPSFTLLGSNVIRLPFILHTSLPHEILHNWWGNGVYVDYANGNWSEGLTAYMADHYLSEHQGNGSEYRRKALERYANFAAEQHDFALANFSSRHNEASQAVGYSKSLMLFHMLKKLAGENVFYDGIRRFWQHYQFQYASFPDLIQLLYPPQTSKHDDNVGYREFTEQWLNRTGAPEITLDNVSVSKKEDAYLLTMNISQQQSGPVYRLQIPLEVKLQDQILAYRANVFLTQKNQAFTLKLEQQPLAVTLDPDYDVFRLLQNGERPASLGRVFGATKQFLVLPAKSTTEQIEAWQALAAAWSGQYNNVELVYDNEIKVLPDDAATWLLGWNNGLLEDYRQRFTSQYTAPTSQGMSQSVSANGATIAGQQLHAENHAVVLLDVDNTRNPLGFIGAHNPQTIALLARKLPHYSSYGALAFALPDVKNIIRERLPVIKSPMTWKIE